MMLLNLLLSVIVSAQLDSTELWIGQQTKLHLSANIDKNEQVQFPVYGELLQEGIEIVDRTSIDSLKQKGGRLLLKQDLTITSFTDSLFLINPLPFVVGTDTIYTDPATLNVVQPFVIDTADNTIADIKPVFKAPIWWWGIIRWILLAIGLVGLGVGAYFLYTYLRRLKSQKTAEPINPELLRPAHEVALEKLDVIKQEKLWQLGRPKEYHTQLTDVVREYIARRYDISSQEQTSDEILADIKPLLAEQRDLFSSLKQMLHLADLVKFAKWQPAPDENERSLMQAYKFVNETTITEEPKEEL